MKITNYLLLMALLMSLWACTEETPPETFDYTFSVIYAPATDVQAGKEFTVIPQITNPGSLTLKYEVVGGKKADNTDMSWIELSYFTFPEDAEQKGTLKLMNNHPFTAGTHSVDVFVWYGEMDCETTFTFTITAPMVDSIAYTPNSVTWDYDTEISATSAATLFMDGVQVSDEYKFTLLTDTDKLQIDPNTGTISPNPTYVPELGANLSITPSIKISTADSTQHVEFTGSEQLLKINIVKAATARLGRFFIPTVEAMGDDGTGTNFKVITPQKGNPQNLWTLSSLIENYREPYVKLECVRQDLETPLVGELPEVRLPIWGVGLTPPKVDGVVPASQEFESWMVFEPQDLTLYNTAEHDVSATVWMQNEWVLYFADGTSPTNVQLYMSNTHDYNSANISESDWTEVTTIKGQIHHKAGGLKVDGLTHIPYLGNNTLTEGDVVADKKNTDHVWEHREGPWLKVNADMSSYLGKSNFMFAIRVTGRPIAQEDVYQQGQAVSGLVRPGNVHVANVYYTATEK